MNAIGPLTLSSTCEMQDDSDAPFGRKWRLSDDLGAVGGACREISDTLGEVLSDMSSEIAGTDNPAYRRILESRRDRLSTIHSQLDGSKAT